MLVFRYQGTHFAGGCHGGAWIGAKWWPYLLHGVSFTIYNTIQFVILLIYDFVLIILVVFYQSECVIISLMVSQYFVRLYQTLYSLNNHRHLEENLDEWLTEELDNYLDDDYLVFDCPGSITVSQNYSLYVQQLKLC